MARKKRDCAKWLLAATNPFSVHRKKEILKWAILVGLLFCGALATLMYFLNSLDHGGR